MKMALLKYFEWAESKKRDKIDSVLPKNDGSLAQLMPMSVIWAANTAAKQGCWRAHMSQKPM